MNWGLLAGIIAKEGLPLALDIYDVWSRRSSDVPSVEEIAALRKLADQTSRSQMLEALARAGIDPESEQGKKFLGLI